MRVSVIFKILSILPAFLLLCANSSNAQSYDSDDRPVLQEEFCILIKKIIDAKAQDFESLAGKNDEAFAGMDGLRPVREDAVFTQARRSMLVGSGSTTKYRTVFMTRDSKDGLIPSYNNVFSIVKDCLFFDYEFKETAYFGLKEAASLGYRTYENIGKPLQIHGKSAQAIVYLFIEKNRRTGQFELVLEIR